MKRIIKRYTVLFLFIWLSGYTTQPKEIYNNLKGYEMQQKSTLEFLSELKGEWNGTYKLWLRPDTPAQNYEASAKIYPAAKENFYLMTYTWKNTEKEYEGIFLLGGSQQTANTAWGDSFHMTPEPMICKGELSEDGEKIVLNGSYAAGDGPDWGWRTELIKLNNDSFVMEAYNIMPDGFEALAVKAEFKRR